MELQLTTWERITLCNMFKKAQTNYDTSEYHPYSIEDIIEVFDDCLKFTNEQLRNKEILLRKIGNVLIWRPIGDGTVGRLDDTIGKGKWLIKYTGDLDTMGIIRCVAVNHYYHGVSGNVLRLWKKIGLFKGHIEDYGDCDAYGISSVVIKTDEVLVFQGIFSKVKPLYPPPYDMEGL